MKIIVGLFLIGWGISGLLGVDFWGIVSQWWPVGVMMVGLMIVFNDNKWVAGVIGFAVVIAAAYFILGNSLEFFR